MICHPEWRSSRAQWSCRVLKNEFDASFLNIQDFMPVLKKAHLKFELLSFCKMAGGMGRLCAEKRHQRKNPLIDADHDLFVELAALREGCSVSEIVDIEKLRSALR